LIRINTFHHGRVKLLVNGGALVMPIATIIAVAAVVIAFGLVGATVARTFARMSIDIR
jgi:hypothetical protein